MGGKVASKSYRGFAWRVKSDYRDSVLRNSQIRTFFIVSCAFDLENVSHQFVGSSQKMWSAHKFVSQITHSGRKLLSAMFGPRIFQHSYPKSVGQTFHNPSCGKIGGKRTNTRLLGYSFLPFRKACCNIKNIFVGAGPVGPHIFLND